MRKIRTCCCAAFATRRLGGLDRVLLAYRQDQLTLKKLLPGRATFMGSAWRNGIATGEVLPAMAGIANHAAKGALDVATLALGLNRQMQSRRLRPVSPAVEQRWRQLRAGLVLPSPDFAGNAG